MIVKNAKVLYTPCVWAGSASENKFYREHICVWAGSAPATGSWFSRSAAMQVFS